METVLVVVTVVSLLIAAAMAIVAWRLLRSHQMRTAARAEALAALARSDETTPDAPAAAGPAPSWDAALHQSRVNASTSEAPVDTVSSQMFSGGQAPVFQSRRWLALAAAALAIALSVGTIYALSSRPAGGKIMSLFSPGERRPASGGSQDPLELLSLRHTSDTTGGFTITGLVHNPAGGPTLRKVVAVVYLFDQEGRYFASGRTPLDLTALQPGDESPFMIKVTGVAGVSRYRVGFRLEDGGVVAHVDRRGQAPGGTTGDAIDSDRDRSIAPIAAPRRSEG